MLLRPILALVAALFLAACGADKTFAPQEQVDAARYVAGPPASITLVTVVNTRNGTGAHTGLIINASERVLFDPAGTWQHPSVPVQNDVHFGITDRMVDFYLDYHTRPDNFDVIVQTLVVSPQTAELVLARAKAQGAAPKGQCSLSTTAVLSGVPGFESIGSTWFPKQLRKAFGQLPGVTERYLTEADTPNTHGVVMQDPDGKPVD